MKNGILLPALKWILLNYMMDENRLRRRVSEYKAFTIYIEVSCSILAKNEFDGVLIPVISKIWQLLT